MRDLIDATERAVANATPGRWLAAPCSSIVGQPIVSTHEGRSIASITPHDEGAANAEHIVTIDALSRHPDFFAALRLYDALKRGDKALVERVARSACHSGGLEPDELMPNDGPRWGYYVDIARAVMQELVR